jgi:hypothetical protein
MNMWRQLLDKSMNIDPISNQLANQRGSALPPNTACSATGWIGAIFHAVGCKQRVPVLLNLYPSSLRLMQAVGRSISTTSDLDSRSLLDSVYICTYTWHT